MSIPLDAYAKQYIQFEEERTRPVRDLLAAVPSTPIECAIDIGCGPGNSTELLIAHAPDATIQGFDSSSDMINAAKERLPHIHFEVADIAQWNAPDSYDLILANVSLQWVSNHHTLLPQIIHNLKSGGHLAFQIPDNLNEPAHQIARSVAAHGPWSEKLKDLKRTDRLDANQYYTILAPHCSRVDVWRTTYYHVLNGGSDAVVEWFKGSALRPYLSILNEDEQHAFISHYQDDISKAYPALADGTVLLPFPRLFIVATRKS
jgi:trans-aconitate 2-methyltransferase